MRVARLLLVAPVCPKHVANDDGTQNVHVSSQDEESIENDLMVIGDGVLSRISDKGK